MIDLDALADTLVDLRAEMISLGMPKTLVDRIDMAHFTIPSVEMYRDKKANR